MKIGVFANRSNNQARMIFETVNLLDGLQCEFYNLSINPVDEVSLDKSHISWNGSNLEELDIAYIHGFCFMNPVIPSTDDEKDWSLWQPDYLVEQQKYSFLLSTFKELKRRGVTLINPPDAHIQSFMKFSLLEQLSRSDFSVPELLCSNHMPTVKEFCSNNELTLWRPATGKATWQMFLDKQRDHLIKEDTPPVLLAEGKNGPLIRGFFYNGKPLLMLKFGRPQPSPPEKLEQFSLFEDYGIAEKLKHLNESLGAKWLLVFFIINEGKPWIYDIDVDPILDWLPDLYRKYLIKQLAYSMAGIEKERLLPEDIDSPVERPVFFLRRMLQILFEFEKSKYG